MWPDSKGPVLEEKNARPSVSAVVPVEDCPVVLGRDHPPAVGTLNVTKSSRVHIGTKNVNITQNDVVKDLPLSQYLWNVIKNTTRAERLSCGIALFLVILCNILIVYFTVFAKSEAIEDVSPHEWNITREMWLAQPYNTTEEFVAAFEPLRVVVIQHTVSTECFKFDVCAEEMRVMQKMYLTYKDDIPYNFIIGNDGRVYEGRGWHVVGAHTKYFNRCSIGLGFVGDYRNEEEGHVKGARVTEKQLNRTLHLLDYGVQIGILHPEYLVVGAKDVSASVSPGLNLYNEIKKWKHFDKNHIISPSEPMRNQTCDKILALPFPKIAL